MTNELKKKPVNSAGSNGSKRPLDNGKDKIKWLFFWILIAAALVANVYYQSTAWALRAAAGVVLLCVLAGIAATTQLGAKTWGFINDARGELRKVVWPTRAEATQTALLVVVMVIVVALILWGLDSVLMWGIGFLTL